MSELTHRERVLLDIMRGCTVDEAFTLCERYAQFITITGTDTDRVESITLETVRWLRKQLVESKPLINHI